MAGLVVGGSTYDLRASRDFSTTLFANDRWLVGAGERAAYRFERDIPPPTMDKFARLTQGLAGSAPQVERLQLLNDIMTPSRFPQVLMLV